MSWNLYDVAVQGYGAAVITAPSRGKALASAWRSDAFSGISFRDFLKIASAKNREAPLEDDGYGYVRRHYGVNPQIGQRVRCFRGLTTCGRPGTVLYPGKCTAHVRVLFDGWDHPSNVHPTDLLFDGAQQPAPLPASGSSEP